jgi:hypothetical protein
MEIIKNPKIIPIWALIFFILLIINGIFLYQVGLVWGSSVGLGMAAGFAAIWVYVLAFPLLIIDFIAVLFYVIKQHPQGIFKVISYAVLAVISWMLLHVGIANVNIYFS